MVSVGAAAASAANPGVNRGDTVTAEGGAGSVAADLRAASLAARTSQ